MLRKRNVYRWWDIHVVTVYGPDAERVADSHNHDDERIERALSGGVRVA